MIQADHFRGINATIERLAGRRLPKIEVEGPFLQSKLAWKVASYQQAILYRVVMLARGARVTWNARNMLATYVLVRALTETVAVFDEFESELGATLDREDIGAMDKLTMNRLFATKNEEMLQEHPESLAINVLTFINKMEKRYDLPIRAGYDNLSERCHPNAAGHHQMFTITDRTNGTVTFTETKKLAADLDCICAPLGLVQFFEQAMNKIDQAIPKIADLHHRLHPVGSNRIGDI